MPATVLLAIGTAAVWVAGLGAVFLRGRGRREHGLPGPTPAAVRTLLVAPGRDDDPRVLNSAVMELAARNVIEIIPADSQGPAMIRPAALPDERLLPEYLNLLLARVCHRSGPRGAPIPLTSLRADEDRAALGWSYLFDEAVREEAVARGLLQPAARPVARRALLMTSLLPSVLIAVALGDYVKQPFPQAIAFITVQTLALVLGASASRVRVTKAGVAELAAAYPREPVAVPSPAQPAQSPDRRVLPEQLSPLPEHQIWSSYGGSWHPLDLRSREVYRDSGARPAQAGGIFAGTFCVGSAIVQSHRSGHISPAVAVAFVGLPLAYFAAIGIRTALRRKLPKRLVLQGKIARLWAVEDADARTNRTAGRNLSRYYCVLDVGRAPESVRLNLGPRTYESLRVGDVVEVSVRPRRGRIAGLRNLGEDFA
ncbi:hypothetical protein [Actinospica robiniae]|uniref:hypothetical protein n=1 Tax=Actinospica robiniae TaxID=304901 RepID=UPI0003F9AA52|nr:hypothetical protein [Actinospica robiniae]